VTERLQKFLAGAGVASRRHAEALIAAGRVAVNGTTVTAPGTQVDPERDLVAVDGRPVERRTRGRYLLLYKPPGCVTTLSDPQGRPTAAQYLQGVRERVFPVGRLDWDAEGALLFTTDGELANRLAHPRYGHRRTYLAKVKGEPPASALDRMVAGVRLEDGPARAIEAVVHERAERNTWIRVAVGEGRKHLVKRLCEAVGLEVLRLFRPEFGGVSVDRLRPGQFRDLGPDEVRVLRHAAGLAGGAAPAPPIAFLPRAARRHGHGPPAPPPGPDGAPRTARRDGRGRPADRPPAGSPSSRTASPRPAAPGPSRGAPSRPGTRRSDESRPGTPRPGTPRPGTPRPGTSRPSGPRPGSPRTPRPRFPRRPRRGDA
jgi:23S rRNA pseudouridine2605 synthase